MILNFNWLVATIFAASTVASSLAQAGTFYETYTSSPLAGRGHSWGFAALQPQSSHLFLARRENGLSVFDVETRTQVAALAGSEGANAVAFAPVRNRAYAANTDGTLSVVDLGRLAVSARLRIDADNLNNVVYLPGTRQLLITTGRRDKVSTVYLFDTQQDKVTATIELPARKLDAPVGLADGSVVIPMRDENQVVRLSGPGLVHQQTWAFPGCSEPSAVAADEATDTLFVACRGGAPSLIVAGLADGMVKQRLPVGRAVNALAYDSSNQTLYAPSGADAELRVFKRTAEGGYATAALVGTRPWAHNMVFDAQRGQLYLMAMSFTQPLTAAGQPQGDPVFQDDTFEVLVIKATQKGQ